MKSLSIFLVTGLMLLASQTQSQTVSIMDTTYTPQGDPDGSWIGTLFVPAVGNGIGAVLAHGTGVSRWVIRGWCDTLAARGYVAMTVEYPDAGLYPKPPRALKQAVQFLRRHAARFGITTNQIVGFGMSGGAISWGEAIIRDNDFRAFNTDSTISDHLDAAVLLYGIYHDNFNNAYDRTYFRDDSLLLANGTPYLHAANVTSPVLLMHGTSDATVNYLGSVEFHDSLVAHGKIADLVLFPGQPHAFDLTFPDGRLTQAGLVAKDTALAFLNRTVHPALRIRVSSSMVDFRSVRVPARDAAMLRVENIGDSALHLSAIANTHPEYQVLDLPPFPQTMQPGGSIQFRVMFQPTSQGVVNDTILIASDDPLHPALKVSLHGKGVSTVLPASAGLVYATSAANPAGSLLRMKIPEGSVDTIGSLGVPDMPTMSIRHSDGLIYATTITSAPTGIYQIDATTGEASLLTRFPVANLSALAFSRGDTLYGATRSGSLYRIDLGSGKADSIGTSPGLAYTGLSFRPTDGELWAAVRTPTDNIFRLDPATGRATFVGTTGFNAVTSSIAFDSSGTLYALIDNGTGEDYLATIDTVTGSGTIIAGPLSVSNLLAITMISGEVPVSVQDRQLSRTPFEFALEQNYPNPFNPSTSIKYEVPRASHVSLRVYDVLGREVSVLVNEKKDVGVHEVTFDAAGLASGVYFYRLQAGAFVQTRRLLLLR